MNRLLRLRREVQELGLPLPTPTEAPKLGEATKLAFCPVLMNATGRGYCKDPRCGDCGWLSQEYGTGYWYCSTCAAEEKVRPFWADGNCSRCGQYSPVLVLLVD